MDFPFDRPLIATRDYYISEGNSKVIVVGIDVSNENFNVTAYFTSASRLVGCYLTAEALKTLICNLDDVSAFLSNTVQDAAVHDRRIAIGNNHTLRFTQKPGGVKRKLVKLYENYPGKNATYVTTNAFLFHDLSICKNICKLQACITTYIDFLRIIRNDVIHCYRDIISNVVNRAYHLHRNYDNFNDDYLAACQHSLSTLTISNCDSLPWKKKNKEKQPLQPNLQDHSAANSFYLFYRRFVLFQELKVYAAPLILDALSISSSCRN